ncbi:hypothetical protein N7517_011113 [Penicillium concentricum]|uniref:Uncharacterized protein n=1 Tax=Penicillium concentricum TaxID=293559 RepID=A0A9W9RBY8_9EURO|nr:uncharacterized protein N7517_011113 [Penicillium concentricum]KAJ5356504.1 hypothetical protein N7517_011113 [Penicillium concentricum]
MPEPGPNPITTVEPDDQAFELPEKDHIKFQKMDILEQSNKNFERWSDIRVIDPVKYARPPTTDTRQKKSRYWSMMIAGWLYTHIDGELKDCFKAS